MMADMMAGMLDPARTRQRLAVLFGRHGGLLPQIIAILLLVWLAHQAADFVWAVVPLPAGSAWRPPAAMPAQALTGKADELTTITGADLFGAYQAAAAPSVSALVNAPETNLNLTLLGILANRVAPQLSRAVIAGGAGGEKPYSIGDAIGSGVTLRAIFPDRVVLARSGRLETLRLSKNGAPAQGDVNTPIAVAGANAAPPTQAAKLSQLRTELLANPNKVGNYISVQPMPKPGGGQVGYRIYPGPNTALFQTSGLRAGDLVTAVNGVPLTDPGKTLQLLSQLSNAGQVSLTIKRGNHTQDVTLNFAQ